MRKKLVNPILLLLIIAIFSSFVNNKNIMAEGFDADKVNPVLDYLTYNNILPKNFRKTSDLSIVKEKSNLKFNGLDKLNISGSQQFSEDSLPLLIEAIGTQLPVTVVDLRQESHGFINGLAVSWADSRNNANVGLSRKQVLRDEAKKLKSIKLNRPLNFYNKR